MKIAKVEAIPLRIPFSHGGGPAGWGGQPWSALDMLLIRVETESGIVGWGEAFSYRCRRAVHRDVYQYLKMHDLPYHPLWDKGYISIGDVHTTHSLSDVGSQDETRFFGLQRECGLHEMDFGKTA